MSFIAGLRNLSNTTPAIDSFRQASLNPAITQSFVRPSEARQATKVTEPITFTNILEEEEEPFVDVTGDLGSPEDFVRVTPSRGSANRDFTDTNVDRSEISIFSTPTERATAEALSNKFDAQETTTKSLFGPVSFGQETQNQTSYGPPTAPFTARPTPSDIKKLQDNPNTSAFELAAAKTELALSDLAGRIQTGFEDVTPKTVFTELGEQVAKEATAGFILGANPALGVSLDPLGLVSPATLIASGLFAVGEAGIDMAQSEFSGFGVDNFFEAFFNSFVPFADTFGIGTSVSDMTSQQVAFDSLAEDVFSLGIEKKDVDAFLDDSYNRGLFIDDPLSMRTFEDGEIVNKSIQDEIKRAREEVEAQAELYDREQRRQLEINEAIKKKQREEAAAKEAERKAAEQAFIRRFTSRARPKKSEAVQMPDGTVAFMTKGEQKQAMGQGMDIRGGSTGRAAKFLGYRSNRGSRGMGYGGSGYSMGRRGTGGATPP